MISLARTDHTDRSAARSRPKWHDIVRRTSQYPLQVDCCKLRAPTLQACNLLLTPVTRLQKPDQDRAAWSLGWLVNGDRREEKEVSYGRPLTSGKRKASTEPMKLTDDTNLARPHLWRSLQVRAKEPPTQYDRYPWEGVVICHVRGLQSPNSPKGLVGESHRPSRTRAAKVSYAS